MRRWSEKEEYIFNTRGQIVECTKQTESQNTIQFLEMRMTPLKKVSVRGEPIPFRAYIPKEEVIQYRKVQI